ncbi:alpha/beta hydrolase [Motilibacter deserti]|uniref:Alpha/beta hydrolase n=1 Tax=Motilibacter deserti TaxID=2714956 RepID=A0ABX0GZ85_9ACTN|nr:alpha/beta hydrolase [Motilibacter deserti]
MPSPRRQARAVPRPPTRAPRTRLVGAGLLAAVLLAAGCTSDGDGSASDGPAAAGTGSAAPSAGGASEGALAGYYGQELDWGSCGESYQCAKLRVPVDYADPEGGDLELSVVRRPAGKKSERVGSLLVNPGGPGGSGIDYARSAENFSTTLLTRFDIVGFDPRGVGTSSPIDCLSDEQTDTFLAVDASPDDAREEAAYAEQSRLLGEGCEARSGEVLPHVGTVDAAKDMDVLRAVLGDETLTYLGKSYGTYLGAVYAEQFPDKVGRFVLDGALDPTLTDEALNLGQAKGFETALTAFVDDCLQQEECPLTGGRDAGLAQVRGLLDDIDREPLRSDDGREVTQPLAALGLATGLYSKDFWPYLEVAIADALDGDGTTLLTLTDAQTDRTEDGTYASNGNEVIYAVNCLDKPSDVTDLEAWRERAATAERAAPTFGALLGWSSLPCATWPARSDTGPHEIAAPGAAPILVVGTTRDPATPYEWAQGLAGQLESGRLLTFDGDGHTAYASGSRCVDEAVDAYLVEGTLPAEGARC